LLRKYFSGQKFSENGSYYSPVSARLRASPAPKIALAALSDQMIRKAASIADRVILNLYPIERIKHALNLMERSAGNKPRPNLSVMLYAYVIGNDEAGMNAGKDLIAFYASAPAYSTLFKNIGFKREAEGMMRAWQSKDRDAVRAIVTRSMIDKLMVLGTVTDLRERIRSYHENGVDDVFISPSPFGDYEANVREVLRNFKSR